MEIFERLTGLIPFTSVFYLLFLTGAVVVFFALRRPTLRALWLVLASSVFYALVTPKALVVLAAMTAIGYLAGLALDRMPKPEAGTSTPRKLVAGATIVLALAVLVWYKFSGSLAGVLGEDAAFSQMLAASPALALAVPAGISFWTLQLIAYVVEVYRGGTPTVRNPAIFAASVMFFPTMTMGPIAKIGQVAEQLAVRYRFDYSAMRHSLLLIGWGFFKKLVIADRLGVFVGSVFGDVTAFSGRQNGLIFAVAAVFYALQLYADFSGYTDIVRGSARLFGVTLPENFRAPYLSRSVAEFWRRWHMTLMDWLKTYVYFTLGGNRKGQVRKYLNTFAVFLMSGIWHGTGVTFLWWGILNAFYIFSGEALRPVNTWIAKTLRWDRESTVHRVLQSVITFWLITMAWVLFRAESVADALYMYPRMFMPTVWIFSDETMVSQGLSQTELLIAFLAVVLMFIIDYIRFERGRDIIGWLTSQHVIVRWALYYGLIFVVVLWGWYGGSSTDAADFLYFQF